MIAKHIGTALRALAPRAASLMEIGLLFGGAALIAYGAWEVYKPAGPIVAGILVITGVILRARGT